MTSDSASVIHCGVFITFTYFAQYDEAHAQMKLSWRESFSARLTPS
jgi:hypothetical protein